MRLFSPDRPGSPANPDGYPVVVVEWADHTEMLFEDRDLLVLTRAGLLEFPAKSAPQGA